MDFIDRFLCFLVACVTFIPHQSQLTILPTVSGYASRRGEQGNPVRDVTCEATHRTIDNGACGTTMTMDHLPCRPTAKQLDASASKTVIVVVYT